MLAVACNRQKGSRLVAVKPRFYKDKVFKVGGGMGLRWSVCEVWADGWAEGEGKGGVKGLSSCGE
jgi:hypothetical protein